jgi:histidine triad (HIT) family protein
MSYDTNNAFARILRGEMPCIKVSENEHTLAFMDIQPQADGHVLIIPKEAAATLFELSAESTLECMKMTRRVAIAVKAALKCKGMMIIQVNGAAAGQTVPHVHFHVIPREADIPLRAHAATNADPEKLKRQADLIVAALHLAT